MFLYCGLSGIANHGSDIGRYFLIEIGYEAVSCSSLPGTRAPERLKQSIALQEKSNANLEIPRETGGSQCPSMHLLHADRPSVGLHVAAFIPGCFCNMRGSASRSALKSFMCAATDNLIVIALCGSSGDFCRR